MAFIEESDMTTHITAQSIAAIKQGDSTKLEKAIASGILQASSYLGRYDLESIWAATDEEKEGIYSDLIFQIKTIIKWKFIQNSNAGTDAEIARLAYKDAKAEIERYGQQLQPGWPVTDDETAEQLFRAGSRPKFDHYGFSSTVDPDYPF